MKVFFIGSGYAGCYYVRCLVPLAENGWRGEAKTLKEEAMSRPQMFEEAMKADIVVFQRPMQQEKIDAARLLKQAGKMIVMDNDDTYQKDSGTPMQLFKEFKGDAEELIGEMDRLLREFVQVADMVTVTTSFLADEYKDLNQNIEVLPNVVDPYDWPEEPQRNEGEKVRILITGSVINTQDYTVIKPILDELGARDDVELVLFALPANVEKLEIQRRIYKEDFDYWDSLNPEWHPWVGMRDYIDKLDSLKADIILIPRREVYFNRCKSNLKFLEASMLEIPTVAQRFSTGDSPYEQNPQDKDYMLLCNTEDEWRDAINKLIDDKKLRRDMGKKAKEYVLEEYNIETKAHLWEDAYKKVWNKKQKDTQNHERLN